MKIDLKKQYKDLYTAPAKAPVFIQAPALTYLMIDGAGDPNTAPEYAAAVEALYSVSYAAKFIVKKGATAVDYGVMPLEGLWWTAGGGEPDMADKSDWLWTAMIMQPEWVGAEVFQAAREKAEGKLKRPLDGLRLETVEEGRCAQILHLGPYADEPPTIAALHAFIAENGEAPSGKHHEIYLSDPRRTEPARLKTILRQPV